MSYDLVSWGRSSLFCVFIEMITTRWWEMTPWRQGSYIETKTKKASIQRKESQQSKNAKQNPGTKRPQIMRGKGAACANRLIANTDTKGQKEHSETVSRKPDLNWKRSDEEDYKELHQQNNTTLSKTAMRGEVGGRAKETKRQKSNGGMLVLLCVCGDDRWSTKVVC